MSMGNAMNTSLPVGWSSARERLMLEAVLGACATLPEVESWSGLLGTTPDPPFRRMTTSHRISSLSIRVSAQLTSTSKPS
jgi:hypothetical protein